MSIQIKEISIKANIVERDKLVDARDTVNGEKKKKKNTVSDTRPLISRAKEQKQRRER